MFQLPEYAIKDARALYRGWLALHGNKFELYQFTRDADDVAIAVAIDRRIIANEKGMAARNIIEGHIKDAVIALAIKGLVSFMTIIPKLQGERFTCFYHWTFEGGRYYLQPWRESDQIDTLIIDVLQDTVRREERHVMSAVPNADFVLLNFPKL